MLSKPFKPLYVTQIVCSELFLGILKSATDELARLAPDIAMGLIPHI